MYDAGLWFVGLSGHLMRGKNVETGVGLSTIIPRKVTTTAGLRLLDRQLFFSPAVVERSPATPTFRSAICRRRTMTSSTSI